MTTAITCAMVVAAIVYATYFILRYAAFSLTIDHQSLAIERMIRAEVSLADFGLSADPEPFEHLNRTPACSFWLMEEMWRDCKMVHVGVARERLTAAQAEELRRQIAPIIQHPCRKAKVLVGEGSERTLKQLDCDSGPRSFVATVMYAHETSLETAFVQAGTIE